MSVGVVGLGLIGGSLARGLAAVGVEVVATDPSAPVRSAARDMGLEVTGDIGGLCARRPDLVVLAVPLRVMREVAAQVAAAIGSETGWDPTVTDVGSVKGPVRDAVSDAGLARRYVGAHPMAGTENSGFDASFPDLLRGIRWAVTVAPGVGSGVGADGPGPESDPARLASVLRLITGPLGGTVSVLTDERHDEVAALVSHVPHVLAGELLGLVAGAGVGDVALGLAAGSFRDGTRVAYGDPRRAEAMVTQNAAWVAPALRVAARDLERLADTLDSNGPAGWFFDRPQPLRERRAAAHPRDRNPSGHTPGQQARGAESSPESDPPAEQRVPLTGDWPAELVGRCAAGAVVVAVVGDAVVLT